MSESSLLTVLVADDDPDIRQIVSSILEVGGYTAIRAKDGTEAKNKLAQMLPDIAILDLSMPGANGNEVCSFIRKLPGGESVAIMILTARDTVDDKINSLTHGADEYVTKPFNHHELLARVNALKRIRLLNVALERKNRELSAVQAKLVEQERALAVNQLAGAAAHTLGQPVTAIILNTHLLEQFDAGSEHYRKALASIKHDAKRLADMVEQMKGADASRTSRYHGSTSILDLGEKDPPTPKK